MVVSGFLKFGGSFIRVDTIIEISEDSFNLKYGHTGTYLFVITSNGKEFEESFEDETGKGGYPAIVNRERRLGEILAEMPAWMQQLKNESVKSDNPLNP